ncbi:hypothetical protein E7T06_20910 [Deinococcus sp. Arct2-2]|uniref:hypothetical protein n=1 Tax=Deinococcus sp. Arct2-2 TaxID=2568653 RepID=UPI0010A3066F|nr:hypothetical protein [Deinococcus sp. Arct2-2]THF66697.1 hypothetical protein E7T06_20910 [Deinococcus sp. Arct2-2]
MRAFLPILELGASRVRVGLTPDREWVYECQEGQLFSLEEQPQPFMVTLLQLGEAWTPMLIRALELQGLAPALAAIFPVHVGVRLGLSWESDSWQQWAVDWVERDGSEAQFLPELQVLAIQGRTQRIRQAARRLARKATAGSTP